MFEHVSQEVVASRLRNIKSLLRPNGVVFIQVSPLYYSSEGSHMKPWIPLPWAHLLQQSSRFEEQLMARVADPREAEILWMVYKTLNKMTAPQLRRKMEEAGFDILRDYRTKE